MGWSFGLGRRKDQDPWPTELISGEGGFKEEGLKDFINSVKLHERGLSYAVVAIMGPQSSGMCLYKIYIARAPRGLDIDTRGPLL